MTGESTPCASRWMLPVAVGLMASTVYLRYHYAIDLLAGFVWFLAARLWWSWREGQARALEGTVGPVAPTS